MNYAPPKTNYIFRPFLDAGGLIFLSCIFTPKYQSGTQMWIYSDGRFLKNKSSRSPPPPSNVMYQVECPISGKPCITKVFCIKAPHQNERPSSHWKKIIVSKEKRLKDIKDKQFWDPKWNSVRFEIFITVLSSLKTLPIPPSHRLPHLQHNPTLPCLAEFRLRFYNMWN